MNAQITIPIEEYALANGLHVVLHRDPSVPVATVELMYHVGSKDEAPGKTGLAHLFEHIMFKGSEHIADGEHFRLLQEIGANINGSTNQDRTNYYEVIPANFLELALYMESDRMGYLLPALTQEKLDNQRDVVKNERRQHYDSQPYGTAYEKLLAAVFPPGHPYSWPTIGSMDDLSGASLSDVKQFFSEHYAPNNACLVVAGNFDVVQVQGWTEKYFGQIPRGTLFPSPVPTRIELEEERRQFFEDDVELPRLFLVWPSVRGQTREDAVLDVLADILGDGKASRLYSHLVYDQQVAQDVSASQSGTELAGTLAIDITAKPDIPLGTIERSVDDILQTIMHHGVTEEEVERSMNNREAQLVHRLSSTLGKASGLATSHTLWGNASLYNKELERFAGISPTDVKDVARKVFTGHHVVLSAVPKRKTSLAAMPAVALGESKGHKH